jgi:hypothetical protein
MTLDAQQSMPPLAPQAAATPTQLGRGPQVCVVVLQTGVEPLQSALPTQATQLDVVVVRVAQRGVPPAHAAQLAPQLVSEAQSMQLPAFAALQRVLLGHAASIGG